jgi:hypothetical protein
MSTSEFNPTDLHALDERRREASEQSRFEQQLELDDVAWLMSGKRGRRFVWRLLGDARLYQQSFDGNTNWSIFYEGKRSIALKLLAQIHTIRNGAELYADMVNEARVAAESRAARLKDNANA